MEVTEYVAKQVMRYLRVNKDRYEKKIMIFGSEAWHRDVVEACIRELGKNSLEFLESTAIGK